MNKPFWQQDLDQLTDQEWEALCDGCGRCCLQKLQDEDSEEVVFTSIACEFLDTTSCRCKVYPQRAEHKTNCFVIDRHNKAHFSWLPKTCAYRLRHEGKPLYDWHPLLAGNTQEIQAAGISVGQWCRSEHEVPEAQWVEYIVDEQDGF